MCILDFGKVLICMFNYCYIKNKYGNNSRLSFTDIDSLMYEIKTKDVYEDFSKNKEMFDFSNYLASQNVLMIQTNQFFVRWKMKWVVLLLKNFLG